MRSREATRYHCGQMEKLYSGARQPDGPGEVFDLMKREGRRFPDDKAAQFKATWEREDKGIHRNMQKILKLKGDLPPCHKCDAQIVTYCYVTDTICDKFKGWTEEGKTRSFLDMKCLQSVA